MTEQATGESSDITLQERVKLLKVVVDKRRYKAGSDIQWSSKVTRLLLGSLLFNNFFSSHTALSGTWVDGKR